eukprot:984981-Pyramimonas_sp.AAC.1
MAKTRQKPLPPSSRGGFLGPGRSPREPLGPRRGDGTPSCCDSSHDAPWFPRGQRLPKKRRHRVSGRLLGGKAAIERGGRMPGDAWGPQRACRGLWRVSEWIEEQSTQAFLAGLAK